MAAPEQIVSSIFLLVFLRVDNLGPFHSSNVCLETIVFHIKKQYLYVCNNEISFKFNVLNGD